MNTGKITDDTLIRDKKNRWWAVIELRIHVSTSFRLQKKRFPWSDGGCRQNISSHAHFSWSLLVSPAHRTVSLLTHADVWLKSQLDKTSLELTVLKLSTRLLKRHLHLHVISLVDVPHTSSHSVDNTIDLDSDSSDADWNQDTTPRCSAITRTVWSSIQNHVIHSRGKSVSVERKQGKYYQWRAKGMCTKETHTVSVTMRVEMQNLRALSLLLWSRRRPTICKIPWKAVRSGTVTVLRERANVLDIAKIICGRSNRVLGFVNQYRVHLLMKDLCRAANSCKHDLIVDVLRVVCNGLCTTVRFHTVEESSDCILGSLTWRFWFFSTL